MDNLKIFRMAVSDYSSGINMISGSGIDSVYGIINNAISSIAYSSSSEDVKKRDIEKFVEFVNSENRNNKKSTMGVKTNVLNSILTALYNINSKRLSSNEFIYYVSYIERLHKAGLNLLPDIKHEEEIIRSVRAKKTAEEQAEKIRQEELEKKQLLEELSGKTEGEKIVLELKNKNYDEGAITEAISKFESLNSEDKQFAAEALKKHYKETGIWDGKPSKKVKAKIEKIKEALK